MKTEDKRTLLREDKVPFVTPNPVLEKVETGAGKRLRVTGIYQKEDAKNENNRRYPKSVWDVNFAEDSLLMKRLNRRSVLGELEHPESGTTHLGRASHLIEKLWRERLEEGNEYGVAAGDYVLGQHLVFNTPSGLILQELYACKIPVGVSSRGRGDVEADAEGVDVVQDNYEAETWDCVYQPSVEEANPTPVSEKKEDTKKDGLLEEGRDLIRRAGKVVVQQTPADIVELVELNSQTISTLQRLIEDKTGEYNKDDTRVVRGLLEDCSAQLSNIIGKRECPAVQDKPVKKEPEGKDKLAERARRKAVATNEKQAALLASMAGRTVTAEAVAGRLQRMRGRPGTGERQGTVSKKRYDTTAELASGLLTRSRKLKRELGESDKKLEAAVKLGEGLATRLRNSRVRDVVDTAVQEHPELKKSAKLLSECRTVDEAKDKIKLLTSAIPAERAPDDAPAEVESIRVPAGGDSGQTPVRGPLNLSEAMFKQKGL